MAEIGQFFYLTSGYTENKRGRQSVQTSEKELGGGYSASGKILFRKRDREKVRHEEREKRKK